MSEEHGGGAEKIFPERDKITGYDGRALPEGQLQHDVIGRGSGCPDGDNGNTGEEPQDAERYAVNEAAEGRGQECVTLQKIHLANLLVIILSILATWNRFHNRVLVNRRIVLMNWIFWRLLGGYYLVLTASL